ncbi:EthD family reductase [Paraburkholderia sediminicola]|uniref:EthD family reductase n=1 Tax=Paraburkholderia sediminicola TaxID=458836 RepID=UPI0038B8CF3E
MEVCFFLIGHGATAREARFEPTPRDVEGLRRLIIHVPAESDDCDPLSKSDASVRPRCVLQWYFDDLEVLEQALQPKGAIHDIVSESSSTGLTFTQQAMAVRRFTTPNPRNLNTHTERCTYLVSYEGEARDFNAWLSHYLAHHPPLMAQLPGIRELEIYTRLDYRSGLGIERATAMQRNKVVFDDPASLAAALASPIRASMKQDFNAFPPYSGATLHFPMRSIYGNLKPK